MIRKLLQESRITRRTGFRQERGETDVASTGWKGKNETRWALTKGRH